MTTATPYRQALSPFRRQPYPLGSLLEWVCRDQRVYRDPMHDPLALSPTAEQPKTLSVTAEHRTRANALDARVQTLERTGAHDIELFLPMADHLPLFKHRLDRAGSAGMSVLRDD